MGTDWLPEAEVTQSVAFFTHPHMLTPLYRLHDQDLGLPASDGIASASSEHCHRYTELA